MPLTDTEKEYLKQFYFFFPFVLEYVDKSVNSSTFPSILKLADIIPVYKKDL